MRIHRISIRNFRGVESREISLAPTGVTIIEGPNETGKSSLAEAIDLLFDYPHDSKHRNVLAVRPVHCDVGTLVEVELTTGPYHVTYAKQWFRQPETRLTVHSPRAENLTARTAHERMEAILEETLDRDLYRALRFVQGTKIGQGAVGSSVTLISALDAAAAGGSADPSVESSLWEAIESERARYFTPTGRVSQEREELAAAVSTAESRLNMAQAALAALEDLGNSLLTTAAHLDQKKGEALEAAVELANAEEACKELEIATQSLAEQTSQLERAEHTQTNAQHGFDTRQSLIAASEDSKEALDELNRAVAEGEPLLVAAEQVEDQAEQAHEQAEAERVSALAAVELADGDREFRRAEVSLGLLEGRLSRVDEARERETAAQQILDESKVTRAARKAVESAVSRMTEARAAIRAGCPAVEIEALSGIDIEVGDDTVHLDVGEKHEISVTAYQTIGIENVATVRVRSGTSAKELAEETAQAEHALDALVNRYGIDREDPLGSLLAALEARRDAEREIEQAQRLRADSLEDLSEEQLAAKARNSRALVETYRQSRPEEPPLPETAEAADAARQTAVEVLRAAEASEKALRAGLDTRRRRSYDQRQSVETSKELQRQELQRLQRAEAALKEARGQTSEADLQRALNSAAAQVISARNARFAAQRALEALDPENTRLRLENVEKRTERIQEEQRNLETRQIELKAALKEKGASDLQAEIDEAEAVHERLRAERDDIERRAAAAQLLYETFARHRDAARLAYVAPYKEQIDRLARLVFGSETSVEIDSQDFSIVSRVRNGVAVPYESLSTGTREQIAVLARLACAILVNPEGAENDAGVPVILDDALGYSDPERLRLVAPAFTAAAKRAQVIVMTSMPDRYSRIGDAVVIQFPDVQTK